MAQQRDITMRRARVPDLLVEQLALGELPPDRAAKVRAQLEAEPDGFERLAKIRRSNDELLFQYPPRQIAPAVAKRAGIQPKKSRSQWFFVLPVAAAAAAFALMARNGSNVMTGSLSEQEPSATSAAEVILTKGQPRLVIYKKTETGSELLQPGAKVHARDTLQLQYLAGEEKWRYGVAFSIDGKGAVTLHYPEQIGQPQDLQAGKAVALPHAYELDDAPDFERFFFVASEEPVDINAILIGANSMAAHKEAAAAGYLNLPQGQFSQWSMTLRKEAP